MALVLGELNQGLAGLGLDPGPRLDMQGRRLRGNRRGNKDGGAQARPDLPFLHGFPLGVPAAAASLERLKTACLYKNLAT